MRMQGVRGFGQMDWITGSAALLKTLAPGAPSAGGSSAPGGGYGTPSSTSVSTQVSTQVSPQISPVMVQQQQPQNSAVNANPSMAPATLAPVQAVAVPQPLGTPATGAIPGFDNASGYAPTGVPTALPQGSGVRWTWIAAAVAVAAGAALLLKRKRA